MAVTFGNTKGPAKAKPKAEKSNAAPKKAKSKKAKEK